jgi:hypothetical protein
LGDGGWEIVEGNIERAEEVESKNVEFDQDLIPSLLVRYEVKLILLVLA